MRSQSPRPHLRQTGISAWGHFTNVLLSRKNLALGSCVGAPSLASLSENEDGSKLAYGDVRLHNGIKEAKFPVTPEVSIRTHEFNCPSLCKCRGDF